MPKNTEFLTFVLDQLKDLGPVTARNMFGGTGLYLGGTIFALIAYDTLYLKVDDVNRPDFEKAGMPPFQPFEDKPYVMSYYEVPVDVLEDSVQLIQWAGGSVEASLRAPSRRIGKNNK